MRTKFILLSSLLIAGGLSIFACKLPDGLEKVAQEQGFLNSGIHLWPGLIPDYLLPGVNSEWLATTLAGIIGTFIVFGILYLIGLIINHHFYESK
jgi:cobalt/nickel transport protein